MRKLCCWVFLKEKFLRVSRNIIGRLPDFFSLKGVVGGGMRRKVGEINLGRKVSLSLIEGAGNGIALMAGKTIKAMIFWGFLKSNLRGEMFDLLSSPAATGAATQLPFLLWPLWIIFAKKPFSSFMNYRSSHPAMGKNMLERKTSANLISKKSGENCLLWCFFISFFLSSE